MNWIIEYKQRRTSR